MHVLIYTADDGVLKSVAPMLMTLLGGNDTVTCINDPNRFIGYIEDWGYTVDVLMTEPDSVNFGTAELLPYIRENYPAIQFVYLYSGKAVDFRNHCIAHSALLPVPLDMGLAAGVIRSCRAKADYNRSAGLFVSDRNITTYMPFGNIIYVESQTRAVRIYTPDSELTINENLSAIEKRLDGRFVKCHQSFIVNVNYVRMYICDPEDMNYACLELTNGERIPVSVRKQKSTKSFFEDYCSSLMFENSGSFIKLK